MSEQPAESAEGVDRETYAVLRLGSIPHMLFEDMDAAKEYLEDHDRLNYENGSIIWPVPVHQEGDDAN